MHPPITLDAWLAKHPVLNEAMPLCGCGDPRPYTTADRIGVECLSCGADAWFRKSKNEFFLEALRHVEVTWTK